MEQEGLEASLVGSDGNSSRKRKRTWFHRALWLLFLALIAIVWLSPRGDFNLSEERDNNHTSKCRLSVSNNNNNNNDVVESKQAVVAADDGRCSEIGVSVLEKGGHAVDAAVATAVCLGVVSPVSSGIGGGGFMVVRSSSSSSSSALAIDMRETAPAAASQNMYEKNAVAKYEGALSVGIPGEIAGLHVAWSKYGRLPWKTLFRPAIQLAEQGFIVSPYLGTRIAGQEKKIMIDPGLRRIFAPNGKLLKAGDVCSNVELGKSLRAVAEQGPEALYNGTVGERLIEDVRKAGGILSMEDLRNYKVSVVDALEVNAMGYTILGMPPPSSGTLGLSLDNQLAGVIGGSGGLDIIPAVIQVFINHFILEMGPLEAVQSARVYHRLIPNVVSYENWTVVDGEHIELSEERKQYLIERGHQLQAKAGGAICQLVVQNLTNTVDSSRKSKTDNNNNYNNSVLHGILTAVSDPRKGGWPAAV